jgi:hypothetical protein
MKKKNIFLVKFTVVAAMIGLFSPSVTVETNVQSGSSYSVDPIQLSISLFNTAEARRGGGRGGASRGGSARRSSGTRNRSNTRNRNTNKNRNVNRNKNVNVNVNHRYYGGHRHYGGYYGGRPILIFATGMAIGSIIAASTMPTTCTTIVTAGVSYRQCGSSYYQPFYQGDTLVYKAVASPY